MDVTLKIKDLIVIKSSKGCILSNFFQWDFLNCTNWNNMAILVDLMNNITKSINFRNAKVNYLVEFSGKHSLHIVKLNFVGEIWHWK